MEDLGYYNGRYDRIEKMQVPMNDRACYFGDGLYEVTYTRNHIPYALSEHMERLYSSARELGIGIPLTKKEFSALLWELIEKVDAHEQIVYWQISRGTEMRSHTPSRGLFANIWVTVRPMRLRDIYTPMKMITVEDTRFLHCHMKTLNLLPSVLACQKASEAGSDEAIFVRDGLVTECAHSNIAILREDGTLQTAPTDRKILPGVARAHLLSLCRSFEIPVMEQAFSVAEMLSASEIIVTASGAPCRPICEIDGACVGGKSPAILRRLQDAVMAEFMAETERL